MKTEVKVVAAGGLVGVFLAVLLVIPAVTTDGLAAAVPPQFAEGFSGIVKAVTPAVVNIQVTQGERARAP